MGNFKETEQLVLTCGVIDEGESVDTTSPGEEEKKMGSFWEAAKIVLSITGTSCLVIALIISIVQNVIR